MIKIRKANLDDAELLLTWRNEADSRLASRNQNEIHLDAHIAWLQHALESGDTVIAIAEHNNTPIGSVRAKKHEDCWEMSWVVAPEARGAGFSKPMVAAFRATLEGRVMAWVKKDNAASARIALSLGLSCQKEEDGFCLYG